VAGEPGVQLSDYSPTNEGEITLQGVELDANLSWDNVFFIEHLETVRLHINYAYIDSTTDDFYEKTLQARHSGAAYLIFNYRNDWLSSLAYYGSSEINGESFDGWELGVGKTIRLGEGDLSIKGKVVYWPDKVDSFTVSDTFKVENINDSATTYYLAFGYSFR